MTAKDIARNWRLKIPRYRLIGEICPHCDHKIFPPRDICLNCGDEIKVRFGVKLSDEKALGTNDSGNIFTSVDISSRVGVDK